MNEWPDGLRNVKQAISDETKHRNKKAEPNPRNVTLNEMTKANKKTGVTDSKATTPANDRVN